MKKFFTLFAMSVFACVATASAQATVESATPQEQVSFANEVKTEKEAPAFKNEAQIKAEKAAIRKERNCEALEAMKEMINEDSLKVLNECYVEKYLAEAKPYDYLQFQRIGYFNVDKDSTPDHLIFNRTVTLKDTWAKLNK